MGIMTSLVQGFWVRRQKLGDFWVVFVGITASILGFMLLPIPKEVWMYSSVFLFSITSATVVTALTAICSNLSGKDGEDGLRLGYFRSFGQLGRAFGPIFACFIYWIHGSMLYYLYAIIVSIVLGIFILNFRSTPIESKSVKME